MSKDQVVLLKSLIANGNTEEALELLGYYGFDYGRQPPEFGNPGFGRGWGFGNPYEWGSAPQFEDYFIPDTGDIGSNLGEEEPLELEEDLEEPVEPKKKPKMDRKQATRITRLACSGKIKEACWFLSRL